MKKPDILLQLRDLFEAEILKGQRVDDVDLRQFLNALHLYQEIIGIALLQMQQQRFRVESDNIDSLYESRGFKALQQDLFGRDIQKGADYDA